MDIAFRNIWNLNSHMDTMSECVTLFLPWKGQTLPLPCAFMDVFLLALLNVLHFKLKIVPAYLMIIRYFELNLMYVCQGVRNVSKKAPTLCDWCYVQNLLSNNFLSAPESFMELLFTFNNETNILWIFCEHIPQIRSRVLILLLNYPSM